MRIPSRAYGSSRPNAGSLRTLILGAGEAGRTLSRDLRRDPEYGLEPIGFLDDHAHRSTAGLPIFGPLSSIGSVASATRAQAAVIAIPSLSSSQIRAMAESAEKAGLAVRYLPSFAAALERVARVADLRSLRVDHLLGRSEVNVARMDHVRNVAAGRVVLVTGAGGSIGSELCRQLRAQGPKFLYLLDHDESNLHRLQLETSGEALLDSDEIIIADIRDRERIRQIFDEVRPEIVFHAAAHKHLPLLEQHPCEGVKSNVLGTHNLVEASIASGVERFILISTDKAADPTSVLGATKRIAELILQSHAMETTRFAAVRFGNVLGSRGSFLSVLAEQVANNEPVTVTHPDVSRFFMTVEEAVGLVIEAAHMADYGEIFVLDMGEPVRIVDLVRNYVSEMRLDADSVEIRFTGLRPGEKLKEALFSEREERQPTARPKIWATQPRPPAEDFELQLLTLFDAANHNDKLAVRAQMSMMLPDYLPHSAEPGRDRMAFAAPYPDGF